MDIQRNEAGSRSSKPYPIGVRVAEAWLLTVINPLLAGLDVEAQYLERTDPTWRFQTQRLEVVGNYQIRIDLAYLPNFEHFLNLNPRFIDMHTEYLEKRESLRTVCMELQQALEKSDDLKELYRRLTAPNLLESLGTSLSGLFGAYPPERHISYLAELVVNSTQTLPTYYTVHPLWNAHRDELLTLRSLPGTRDLALTQTEQIATMRNLNSRLSVELKRIRNVLVEAYDIPPAPLQSGE
jgi:hypothetical protein